jgi:hypothetical protein
MSPGYYFGMMVHDSYMISSDELLIGELRLLEVDNRLYLPSGMHIRFLVGATDVLHARRTARQVGLKLQQGIRTAIQSAWRREI